VPTRYRPPPSAKYGKRYGLKAGAFAAKAGAYAVKAGAYAGKYVPKYARPIRRQPARPARTAPRIMVAIGIFALTVAGGLGFVDLVINSHIYHAFLEGTLFGEKRNAKSFDADQLRANWRVSLKATDVRKIGRIVDSFETTALSDLAQRIRNINNMGDDEERRRAVADFAARVESNRSDLSHFNRELRSVNDRGLEGVPAEFDEINASMSRLRQATDVLAVVKAELDSAPDKVTLHDIQKQLGTVLDTLNTKPRSDGADGH
jgi:hypothetical protein